MSFSSNGVRWLRLGFLNALTFLLHEPEKKQLVYPHTNFLLSDMYVCTIHAY